jgi:hypothetical protein
VDKERDKVEENCRKKDLKTEDEERSKCCYILICKPTVFCQTVPWTAYLLLLLVLSDLPKSGIPHLGNAIILFVFSSTTPVIGIPAYN